MVDSRVNSEVGRLRTVMLHRPGAELQRLTPRNSADLLFDGLPWVARAQEEHDAFAQALRDRGVEVLYLMQLVTEALELGARPVEHDGAQPSDLAVDPGVDHGPNPRPPRSPPRVPSAAPRRTRGWWSSATRRP